MRPFRIYYAIIPSTDITNCVAPGYRHVTGENSPYGIKKRQEAQDNYINRLNTKNRFYIKLEESITRDGFHNPILIQAGYCTDIYRKYLPEDHQKDLSKCLCCDRHGGSRLYVGQKLKMNIPCIISDFAGRFVNSDFEELYNESDIMRKFIFKPKRIIINMHGVHVSDPVHTHLENKEKR